MAYNSQYPYSAPSRDAMYASDPHAVAPSQGGIHINVTYPQHPTGPMYQYDPAAHGLSGPHAGYDPAVPRGYPLPSFDNRAAMSADASAPSGYTALAPESLRGHAADAAHSGYVAAYGSQYMPGVTSQFSDSNIDPRLRRPDSSLRSSYRLSEVTDEQWRSSSPDDVGDVGQMGGYGRLPMTTATSRATTESTLTPISDLSSAPCSEPEPTLPTPTPVPAMAVHAMAPPAVPEGALEEASSADEAAPTIVPAPKGATVRRRSRRKSSAGKNPSSSTPPAGAAGEPGPCSSTAKGRRGKKRALEDDFPASAAKRRKDAQPEPEPEAGSFTSSTEATTSSTEATTSSTEATTSSTPAAKASPGEMKCCWGDCEERVLAAALNLGKHLKDCHVKRKEGQDLYPCMWDGCKEEMKFGSVIRHVTTCHLTLGAGSCKVCGATLSRLDSGERHLKGCCRCKDCKKKCATLEELTNHGKLECPGRPAGSSRKSLGKKATKAKKQ